MQKEYKVDVAGFGNQLRIKRPRVWMRVKDNWDQTFSEVPINYDVKLMIKDYGTSGSKKWVAKYNFACFDVENLDEAVKLISGCSWMDLAH